MNRGLTKYLFFTIWGFGCSNLPLFFQFEPNWLSKHLSYSSVIQLRRPSIVKAFSHIWLCQIMFLDFVKWLFHFLFNLRTLTFVTGSAIANSRQSFLKIGHPRPLFRLFLSFHSNIRILTTNKCPSSIQCWDSNPQPLEHESPPITTRRGHLPKQWSILYMLYDRKIQLCSCIMCINVIIMNLES